MNRKKLVIIDAYSLLFRAFYGTRYLSTSDGKPTNALYGFLSMLFLLLEREKPECIAVAFDAPGKTFRHHDFAEYKAQRTEAPDEFKAQVPYIYDLINALNIPSIEVTGYEADDVIGTLSLDAEKHGYETIIVSGDLDESQLVDENIKLMTPKSGVTEVAIYDENAVIEKFGVPPQKVPDYKALVGDSSDNIPGVRGIGPKAASAIFEKFDSVEDIIKRIDEMDPKYRAKIEPELKQLKEYKQLATIVRDAPMSFDYKPYEITPEKFEQAKQLMQSLEFRTLLKKFEQVITPYIKQGKTGQLSLEVVEELPELSSKKYKSVDEIKKWLGKNNFAVFQSENNFYFAIENDVRITDESIFQKILPDIIAKMITHDAKTFQRNYKVYQPAHFDTLLAAYVLQPGRGGYKLTDLAQSYLDEPPPQTPEQKANATYRLHKVMKERLKETKSTKVFEEIEMPLSPILASMENIGIKVDKKMLEEYGKTLEKNIEQTAKKIYQHAGKQFNIGSTQQLSKILFEDLQLPVIRKTKTGFSTGADVLLQLAHEHEIVQEILIWRELSKLKNTYVDALPKLVKNDGRIHTTYAQTVAATGRLSSNDPNLQNIPIRTELGREIRRAFVADEGLYLASLDYSQIELRILAHICKDETLVKAFKSNQDVHAATASIMWNEPIEKVSKEHRRYAKMLNYAVLYGVTDFGLANQLGGNFTVGEAKQMIENYFQRFPKIRKYIEETLEQARSKGYTETLFGRRRYFPDIHAGNRNERMYAERQAINAPLQGSSADMIKLAMIKIWNEYQNSNIKMLLQVHDELVFELSKKDFPEIKNMQKIMSNAMPLNIPVVVDASIGKNWLEMQDIE